MVTEQVAEPALVRCAMAAACSPKDVHWPVVGLQSDTSALTWHVMGVIDDIADETVMVKLVTIVPVAGLWLQAVPTSALAKTKTKMIFDSLIDCL